MPVKVRRSGAWVSVPNGGLFVRRGGVWTSPAKTWVKRNGVWVDTGLTGRPNAPNLGVNYEDYTQIQVYIQNTTSGGTPVATFRTALYNSGGGLLQGPFDIAAPNVQFPTVYRTFTGLSPDTNYIIRAWSISANGVISLPSFDLRRRTGHPEQGFQQANFGWGSEVGATPVQFDGTSAMDGHPGWLATDNNTTTAWVSGPNADPNAFAALVFATAGGNRLLTRIRMWTLQGSSENPNDVYSPYQIAYCGIWINGTLVYNQPVGAGVVKDWYVEGFNYNLQNVTQFNVSMTNMVPWPLAYRGEIAEVVYYYKDWVIVSYTWIVTVPAANNSAW